MDPVRVVSGTAVPLERSDVDTDQIIPSDWLKRVERTGFGQGLFGEWRDDRDFVLNQPEYAGATIQIASTGGLAVTPPAATGTGNVYTFVCTAALTGGSFTFDAKAGNASDLIYGWLQSWKTTPAYTPYGATPVVASTNLITLNGTTTGGSNVGDYFRIEDKGLHIWEVTAGFLIQTGTIATPFSTH